VGRFPPRARDSSVLQSPDRLGSLPSFSVATGNSIIACKAVSAQVKNMPSGRVQYRLRSLGDFFISLW